MIAGTDRNAFRVETGGNNFRRGRILHWMERRKCLASKSVNIVTVRVASQRLGSGAHATRSRRYSRRKSPHKEWLKSGQFCSTNVRWWFSPPRLDLTGSFSSLPHATNPHSWCLLQRKVCRSSFFCFVPLIIRHFFFQNIFSIFLEKIWNKILYCPAVFGHFSPAPVKTDRAVRVQ